MKILAIGAHPDDIEIFMFGFLLCCKEKGYETSMIVATDGSLGGDNQNKKLVKNRKREAKNGLQQLGVPIFLDLPDGSLGDSKDHIIIIRNKIIKIKPDLIVTHYYKDYHSDHISLSRIIKNVVGHYIPILYCDTMMGLNFIPNYYVDITKFMGEKIKSILCHNSQNPNRFVDLANLMNSYRAAQCNAPNGHFAESYFFESSFPFSDIRDFLPKAPKIRPFHIQNINGFL